jgi:CHAD domain-containing protein
VADPGVEPSVPEPGLHDPPVAAHLLERWLHDQTRLLRLCLDALDVEGPASDEGTELLVHEARVALRRLRSALSTFRSWVVAERLDGVRSELGWLARGLGGVRDAQVAADRVRVVAAQGPGEVGALGEALDERSLVALHRAREVAASDRARALLAELETLRVHAPRDEEHQPVPARYVRRDWRRLERRVRRLEDARGPGPNESAAHDVRKAAKRLRYTVEVLAPLGKDRASRLLRKHATRIVDILGEHQDTLVTRREVSAVDRPAGADDRLALWLVAREQARADELLLEFWDAWRAVPR